MVRSGDSQPRPQGGSPAPDTAPPPPARRLIAFYAVLAAVTAIAAIVVIGAGEDKHGQPPIAGGYDATGPHPCLGAAPSPTPGPSLPDTAPPQAEVAGPSFDVKQSGQFVNFSNTQGTLGGKLRLEASDDSEGPRRLHGDVDCVDGEVAEFEGTATPGQKGRIEGTLGGAPVAADLKRDPPDAGAPKPRVPSSIAGPYKLSPRSTCFGGTFELEQHGSEYELSAREQELGSVAYDDESGSVSGNVECTRGGTVRLKGSAVDRNINNVQLVPLDEATPAQSGQEVLTTPSGLPPGGERFTATKQRESFGHLLAAFFIAVAVVMLIARLFGLLAVKLRQPRVMGEVVAGICLGPTVFGALAPGLQAAVFSSDILPAIGVVANLGLIFYLFLVGLEVDPKQLKGRAGQAAAISNASVALPMILGIAVALPIYELVGPDTKFIAFALFMGVAMSITAFPVLGRILAERRMLKRPVGALTLTCAAIDDVTAWFLIAIATAVATQGGAGDVLQTIALAI